MSFSFHLAAPTPPDYQAILFGVNLTDVEQVEDDGPTEGPWPEDVLHFYRPGLSTRGVEVAWEKEQFSVCILTLSSAEDYDLALRFVESAAVILGGDVEPEDGDPFPVEELRERYDEEWGRQTNEAGVVTLRALVADDENTMMMSGPMRPFHIGSALVEELDELGPTEEFQDRLLEAMRQVQNIDPDDYFPAEAMEIGKNDEPEKTVTVAAWGPDVSYLFPDVDYLVLLDEDRDPIFIPYEMLPEILEEGWTFIDERQMLVEAIPGEDWPALLEKAVLFAETPLEE